MKRHLLVFDDGNGAEVDLQAFVQALDEGAELYELDGHVGFLKSRLGASELSERFLKYAGSSVYFIADISSAACSGRLPGSLWDFIKQRKLTDAAE